MTPTHSYIRQMYYVQELEKIAAAGPPSLPMLKGRVEMLTRQLEHMRQLGAADHQIKQVQDLLRSADDRLKREFPDPAVRDRALPVGVGGAPARPAQEARSAPLQVPNSNEIAGLRTRQAGPRRGEESFAADLRQPPRPAAAGPSLSEEVIANPRPVVSTQASPRGKVVPFPGAGSQAVAAGADNVVPFKRPTIPGEVNAVARPGSPGRVWTPAEIEANQQARVVHLDQRFQGDPPELGSVARPRMGPPRPQAETYVGPPPQAAGIPVAEAATNMPLGSQGNFAGTRWLPSGPTSPPGADVGLETAGPAITLGRAQKPAPELNWLQREQQKFQAWQAARQQELMAAQGVPEQATEGGLLAPLALTGGGLALGGLGTAAYLGSQATNPYAAPPPPPYGYGPVR